MAYRFLDNKNIRKELNELCINELHKIQNELREYLTFDIKLIGSGFVRLMTVNGNNNRIDLDYDLIIQTCNKKLINNPEKLKSLFINCFKNSFTKYKKITNHTSVITTMLGEIEGFNFSADFAILIKTKDGDYFKLIFDKNDQLYKWNKIPDSNMYLDKLNDLKQAGYWEEIKKRYIKKKNFYINNKSYSSSTILMEVVNDLYQKFMR